MRLRGETEAGTIVFDRELPHGSAPELAAWEAGHAMVRPIEADRDQAGEIVLRLLVRPRGQSPRPRRSGAGRDAGLVLAAGEIPQIRQRVAAYAIVTSDRGLLATQFSGRTAVVGRWGMPGGGLDPDEAPRAGVLREVTEETAQRIDLGPLSRVQTSHWIGRSPRGVVEDFHAVRLIYRADCPQPSDPVVLDADGTTSQARWIRTEDWDELEWTVGWRAILGEEFGVRRAG